MLRGLVLGAVVGIAGCSAGGTQSGAGQDGGCTGFCATVNTFLTPADVQLIMAQAIQEAQARGITSASIAVVDRTGFVLSVRRIGAAANVTISSGRTPAVLAPFSNASLENVAVDSGLASVSKAITAAYLSSEGNAFTTRTASQIVQENFNPGEGNRPGGPLFGVQFSQLACSDIVAIPGPGPGALRAAKGNNITPNASPLGLSADPGGLPLYKGGTPVGGIGVISDGIYGLDLSILDDDTTGVKSNDEGIALAGTFGFAAPTDRQAQRITVDGKTFRFTDVQPDLFPLQSTPSTAAGNQAALLAAAPLVTVGVAASATAFFDGAATRTGSAFGITQAAITAAANGARFSGVLAAADATAFAGQAAFAARDAFVLTTAAGVNSYIPQAGTAPAGNALTQAEVIQLISSALDVANAARAQIRRPVNSQMRATISVVDAEGRILGIARTRDAPLFGTDVSLQKARTAAFFSQTTAFADLAAGTGGNSGVAGVATIATVFADRANIARVGQAGSSPNHQPVGATALGDGTAFADRSGGNLSRPFYPDGVSGSLPGPFSNPFTNWSPFATGLQLELVFDEIVIALFGAGPSAAGAANTINGGCSTRHTITGLMNGMQIFPGSVPIYRGGTLIGGIGVSGDGIDQDDMVSFLGLHNAGVLLGTIGNAPGGMRADQLVVGGVNLRYIQCPQAPFLNSSAQNICQGK
ncbi:MAG: hypothetical protein HOI95_20335 [Chromatiales bacterium]|nr:hypothetical protein [Chromatiales bacterium]